MYGTDHATEASIAQSNQQERHFTGANLHLLTLHSSLTFQPLLNHFAMV